jgi:thioredoxin-like negative regulator of GroEL
MLYEWIPPAGWPRPPSVEAAQREFDAALAAHRRGDAAEAAERFEAAARLVPESTDPRYAETLAAMRGVARRNAALAQTPIGR